MIGILVLLLAPPPPPPLGGVGIGLGTTGIGMDGITGGLGTGRVGITMSGMLVLGIGGMLPPLLSTGKPAASIQTYCMLPLV